MPETIHTPYTRENDIYKYTGETFYDCFTCENRKLNKLSIVCLLDKCNYENDRINEIEINPFEDLEAGNEEKNT